MAKAQLRVLFTTTAATSLAVLASGCVKKTMATSENFVTKNGDTVIFSLSQNELEMGRFRLCKTPYGLNFGQDDAATMPARTPEFEACKRLNQQIARDAQPKFETVTVDASAVEQSVAPIDDFSEIKAPPKEAEVAEVQGGQATAPTQVSADDVKVTLETKVVRDEVHSFFSGSHLTPRCWYRFDRQRKGTGADFLSTDGRVRTLLNSKRLTRYSVASSQIVKSILADPTLSKMQFNVRSDEVLKAAEYNANLETLQNNQIYSFIAGMTVAGALTLSATQLADVGAALRKGTSIGYYEVGKILTDAAAARSQQAAASQASAPPEKVPWSKRTLNDMLAKKQDFVDKLERELTEFEATNKNLLDSKAAGETSADIESKVWQRDFLSRTKKAEKNALDDLRRRAQSEGLEGVVEGAQKAAARAGFLDNLSHHTGKLLSRGYRMCSGASVRGFCMAAVTFGVQRATQFALDKYTILSYSRPTAADMEVEDLEMAANMFSSSKFNVEVNRNEIELLAAINTEASESRLPFGIPLQGWNNRALNRRNLGFIPILGDSPKSGIVCPTPAVAAQIAGLEEPDGRKFQLLKDAMTKAGMTYIENTKSE